MKCRCWLVSGGLKFCILCDGGNPVLFSVSINWNRTFRSCVGQREINFTSSLLSILIFCFTQQLHTDQKLNHTEFKPSISDSVSTYSRFKAGCTIGWFFLQPYIIIIIIIIIIIFTVGLTTCSDSECPSATFWTWTSLQGVTEQLFLIFWCDIL